MIGGLVKRVACGILVSVIVSVNNAYETDEYLDTAHAESV